MLIRFTQVIPASEARRESFPCKSTIPPIFIRNRNKSGRNDRLMTVIFETPHWQVDEKNPHFLKTMPESGIRLEKWIPAFAGMTGKDTADFFSSLQGVEPGLNEGRAAISPPWLTMIFLFSC
ncbi:MAG: hypothetical protein M0Z61_09615 [Nitrospiraceae bacterium]|nr:hypothetical protein [Nitrospiraceae bacterium]